jgi:hypothetical protein
MGTKIEWVILQCCLRDGLPCPMTFLNEADERARASMTKAISPVSDIKVTSTASGAAGDADALRQASGDNNMDNALD